MDLRAGNRNIKLVYVLTGIHWLCLWSIRINRVICDALIIGQFYKGIILFFYKIIW